MNRVVVSLILLLLAAGALNLVSGQSIMAAWGDSNMLGFDDVGAPTVWHPRIFFSDWNSGSDSFLLMASNDYATLALHHGGGFFGWGAISQYWKTPRMMSPLNPAAWSSDPLAQLTGAGQFWMGISEAGVVYSWSYLSRDVACQGSWEVFGRLSSSADCSANGYDATILPLNFSTAEPILQVGCHASYCIAISQTTVHFWGIDSSTSFTFPTLDAPSTSATPFDLSAVVPSGYNFELLAVARRSEPGDWFFIVASNSSHSSIIFSTGHSTNNNLEDARFLPTSSLGEQRLHFYESTALPTDFSPRWAVAGLRHGVVASASEIYVWGANDYYQLGVITDPYDYSAVPINLTSAFPTSTVFAGLSVHLSTTYVLTGAGGLFVFGPSRQCDDAHCREMDAAWYGQPFLETTRSYNPGPTAIPLPIVATFPPVFTKRPKYTDSIGNERVYGTSFHVLGTILDSDHEVLGPAPDHAIVGWGMSGNAPHDATYTMPYGTDVGNISTSAQRLSQQKPTLVSLPAGVTAIKSLSSVLHSVGAVVEIDGKKVPYVWGGMLHWEPPATPYKTEGPRYEPVPVNTYSIPVSVAPKLDNDTAGAEPEVLQMVWGYDGLVVQYSNLSVSYSDYDPPAWYDVAEASDPLDQIVCAEYGCGYVRASDGSLTTWSMQPYFSNNCYFLGYSDTCKNERRVVPAIAPVLKFGLWEFMGVVVTDEATNCVLTAGTEAYDAPFLGTTENAHSTYLSINFTNLGTNFAGTQVRAMSVGYSYSMFIVDDGTPWIFGFGSNTHGQIMGRGADTALLPTRLPADWIDSEPLDISCVRQTTFLLSSLAGQQKVYVWGFNGLGQMFGEGHGGIYNTKNSGPRLFQLPASLGADYIIKSIIKAPDSPTAFAIVSTIDALTPFHPIEESPEQLLLAVGTDIFEDGLQEQFPRMLPEYYGATTKGYEMDRGQILANETIVKISFGLFTTWYLTDQNRLYGSGRAVCLPSIGSGATFDKIQAVLWQPRLFLDLSSGPETIVDIATHDESVVFLLSNRTVGYFISADRYDCESKVLGDPYLLDEASHHFMAPGYDAIKCRPTTCCFLDRINDVLDCYGEDMGSPPSVAAMPDSIPVFSISGKSISEVYLGLSLIYSTLDNTWMRNSSTKSISPITGLEGRTVLQVGEGNRHMIVNTDIGMFTLIHAFDGYYGHVNNTITLTEFCRYQASFTGVQQVAAWGMMTFWMASDGEVWFAGLDLYNNQVYSPQFNAPVTSYVPGPRTVNMPSGFFVDRIFSRVSYDDTAPATNRIITVTMKRTASVVPDVSAPLASSEPSDFPAPLESPSNPPSQPPSSAPVPSSGTCKGNAPFVNCQCTSASVWTCSGTQTVDASSPISVSNPISIDGDLVVASPGGLVVAVGDLDATNFGKPLISVSGCLVLLQPINLELNTKAVNAVPTGPDGQELDIIESSCHQSAQAELLSVTQKERLCRKISNQPQESNTDSGRVGISVVFRVQTNTCNYWWIILISVLGATVVTVVLVLVVFTKFGVIRQAIQPYRGTNT